MTNADIELTLVIILAVSLTAIVSFSFISSINTRSDFCKSYGYDRFQNDYCYKFVDGIAIKRQFYGNLYVTDSFPFLNEKIYWIEKYE